MIGSNLRRYKDSQSYLGYDVETTDLNLRFAMPWQVSYGKFTSKKIESIKTRYILWPDLKISDDAATITRFNKKFYLERAEDPKKVLEDFELELYDPSNDIVAQNGLGFDVYVHDNWRRALGKKSDFSYLSRYLDTSALTKAIQKGWKPDLQNLLAWMYKAIDYREKGLKSSLEWTGKQYKIEHDYGALHDALSDVGLMIKIFQKQLWMIEI